MEVRASCLWVADHANYVAINAKAIEHVAEHMQGAVPSVEWDFEKIHFYDGGPLTAQYMLVLDAMNFCFWPDDELHYEHLARGLRNALVADPKAFDADRLQSYTGPMLRKLLNWPRELPLEEERARLLREVGSVLAKNFAGSAANLVARAKKSAVDLVELVAGNFPGFRDHTVYKGQQVFIYKRAQIFVADLWGAFKGQGIGEFKDISSITMFADYVVPAVLRAWGILEYSPCLAEKVDSQENIAPGSEEEVEIRACTITAVELLREALSNRTGEEVTSVQVDWWLWSSGIQSIKATDYHHALTVYY
ncbi:hypothetical protein MPTK1_5g18340 [Marchantia polymorpha subsp. ruderalis]|nr:hypothetical protein MARPO_0084s0082 [Marchantia polymorpha]BBN12232.1 hypothetical protein Mp_5g18340 [Marchantia polymorpha subsp. ruderalis]|eukprot:PTQ34020.1 hypothetical protein MARPO_0084s0082 [Marchantia polymorpha]